MVQGSSSGTEWIGPYAIEIGQNKWIEYNQNESVNGTETMKNELEKNWEKKKNAFHIYKVFTLRRALRQTITLLLPYLI